MTRATVEGSLGTSWANRLLRMTSGPDDAPIPSTGTVTGGATAVTGIWCPHSPQNQNLPTELIGPWPFGQSMAASPSTRADADLCCFHPSYASSHGLATAWSIR